MPKPKLSPRQIARLRAEREYQEERYKRTTAERKAAAAREAAATAQAREQKRLERLAKRSLPFTVEVEIYVKTKKGPHHTRVRLVQRLNLADEEFLERYKGAAIDAFSEEGERIRAILEEDPDVRQFLSNVYSGLDAFVPIEVKLSAPGSSHRTETGALVPGSIHTLADVGLEAGTPEVFNLFYDAGDINDGLNALSFETAYINENFRPNACLVTVVIDTFKSVIEGRRQGKYRKTPIDYAHVWQVCKGGPLPEGPLPLSLHELEPFLKLYRLPVLAIGIDYQVIYRFRPETENTHLRHRVLNLLIHNRHCWRLNDDIPRFSQLYAGREAKTVPPLPKPLTYYSLKTAPLASVHFIKTAADILKIRSEEKSVTCLTTSPIEPLVLELLDRYSYEPGRVQTDMGHIESFSLKLAGKFYDVRPILTRDERGDQPEIQGEMDVRRYDKFTGALRALKAAAITEATLSRYSATVLAALNRYPRGPRKGALAPLPAADKVAGVDIVRAYTSCMRDLPGLPVLSVFDEFEAYRDEEIRSSSFYIVEADRDPILFESTTSLVMGTTILYARTQGIRVEIKQVLNPHKVLPNSIESALATMYESDLADDDRKAVANILYGLLQKSRNTNERVHLFQDGLEAGLYHPIRYQLRPSTQFQTEVVLTRESLKSEMTEGFRPIGHSILDAARVLLHKVHQRVLKAGLTPIAVNTDCVFYQGGHFKTKPYEVPDSVNKTGGLRAVEEDLKKVPSRPLELLTDTAPDLPAWPQICFGMKDEYDDSRVDKILGIRTPLLIEGLYPGVGKTSFFSRWALRHKKTVIFVTPWNKLCERLAAAGLGTATLHELLGLKLVETICEKTGQPSPLEGVDMIVFDEIYLHTVEMIGRIAEFMGKHSAIQFGATGDVNQNEPVGQELAVDSDAYYPRLLTQLFPRKLTLTVNKRMTDDRERARLYSLCDALRTPNDKNPSQILREHGIKFVRRSGVTNRAAAHICYYNEAVKTTNEFVAERFHPKADPYASGQSVVCRKHGQYGSQRAYVNFRYSIVGRKKVGAANYYQIRGGRENRVLQVPEAALKDTGLFSLPYAATGHSYQGMDCGPSLYLWDVESPHATRRWVRTAITRCTTLDVVCVV